MPPARLADSRRMRRSPPSLHQWIPANHLKAGEHLQTPNGTLATADGGTTPKQHDGWMWDLTVPGNNDHDFYVEAADVLVLVHNSCGPELLNGSGPVPGVIEVSGRAKSIGAFKNYFPKTGIEYVFDPETGAMAIGEPADYLDFRGSPHQQLARSIGANPNTVLGGMMRRLPDGTFDFDGNSGHYGERWTPGLRTQFSQFLDQHGIPYTYTPWSG
jgi:hypothetical protein